MKVIITGAAGFIGSHAAASFLSRGDAVVGIDNLSRPGSADNLGLLQARGGDFTFIKADCRSAEVMDRSFADHKTAGAVLHEAAQVAVTTSVVNPRLDFDVNAMGTFNVLEAARAHCPEAAFLYASTNKVYGEIEGARVLEQATRYCSPDMPDGFDESCRLDFHSPYGCSKGAADQYVRDYHRIYGMRTVVFRQSCIYGTRQFGIEDQGWISWFTIARLLGQPVTVYGDGKQVRDVLWVDDLIDLYERAIERIDIAAGEIYNVGGGAANALSIRELLELLKEHGSQNSCTTADWRPGDQKLFIANCAKAREQLGWNPTVTPAEGVRRLAEWVLQNEEIITRILRLPKVAVEQAG